MKGVTFQGVERVSYQSVPDPHIEAATDVVVQVRLAGICGSDLHPFFGRETGLDLGTVLGHEFVGEVVELGSAVQRWRSGDLVVCPFTTNCGRCFYCRRDLPSRCSHGQLFGWRQNGEGLHGAQAELVRVPLADATLVALEQGVDPEAALLAGDVLSTGYYCAENGGVGPDRVVAIVGCGPVGLMAVLVARQLGAERVLAIDRIPERLALAARFGGEAIDLQSQEPVDEVAEATAGRGADIVLEAVGSPSATRLAIDLVRPGGTISAVGFHTEPGFPFTPLEAYDKNLTYKTGRCPVRHYIGIVMPLLAAQRLEPTAVISHRLPLSQGPRGYRIFADRIDGCTKVVLTP